MWAMLMREINGSLGIPLLLPTLLQVLELTLRECHENLKQLPHLLSTCIFLNLHINELNIDSISIYVILFKMWTLIGILRCLKWRKWKCLKCQKKLKLSFFFSFPAKFVSFFFFVLLPLLKTNIFLPHFFPTVILFQKMLSPFSSPFSFSFFCNGSDYRHGLGRIYCQTINSSGALSGKRKQIETPRPNKPSSFANHFSKGLTYILQSCWAFFRSIFAPPPWKWKHSLSFLSFWIPPTRSSQY